MPRRVAPCCSLLSLSYTVIPHPLDPGRLFPTFTLKRRGILPSMPVESSLPLVPCVSCARFLSLIPNMSETKMADWSATISLPRGRMAESAFWSETTSSPSAAELRSTLSFGNIGLRRRRPETTPQEQPKEKSLPHGFLPSLENKLSCRHQGKVPRNYTAAEAESKELVSR